MPLATFRVGDRVFAGVQREKGYASFLSLRLPGTMREFLALGPEGFERLRARLREGGDELKVYRESEVRLLPPVPDPEHIFCIGLNYKDHARESGTTVPEIPVVFDVPRSALIADGDPIVLPSVLNPTEGDYEAELVVVIGKGGKGIKKEDAAAHIAGYTCGHDVSARDWQLKKPGGQWLVGKGIDTFKPLGPHIKAADRVKDPYSLRIQLRLNGQTMQDSNTKELHYRADDLIAHLSRFFTLYPGDLIYTGTPGGVGFARKPPVYLKPGDVCEVEIDEVGTLRNPVV